MPEFTAKDVQALRRATGAGMLDAKRALEESEGDVERARRWLREHGLASSGRRSDRPSSQGAVSVMVDGDSIRLTRREFELLRYLVQNKNRVVSRDRLLERVWGYDRSVETRSVDVHVGRLRSKLGDASKQIETVIGLGYRFVD